LARTARNEAFVFDEFLPDTSGVSKRMHLTANAYDISRKQSITKQYLALRASEFEVASLSCHSNSVFLDNETFQKSSPCLYPSFISAEGHFFIVVPPVFSRTSTASTPNLPAMLVSSVGHLFLVL
jgi:hypothetical protein